MAVTEFGMVTVFTSCLCTPQFPHEYISIVMVPSGMLKCPSALMSVAAMTVSDADLSAAIDTETYG